LGGIIIFLMKKSFIFEFDMNFARAVRIQEKAAPRLSRAIF